MKEAALKYLALGFSIIPVGADKIPLIGWKQYQKERATVEKVEEWFATWPDMNIGIITGAISGIVVVDIEAGGSTHGLPPTVTARTGGNGIHLVYRHPGTEVKNGVRIAELTDIRGDGGLILAAPSVSTKGPYEWSVSFEDAEMQPYPAEAIRKLSEQSATAPDNKSQKSWRELLKEDVGEGARNNSAAKIAGGLLKLHPASDWEEEAWPRLAKWNLEHCKPSLPEDELRSTFKSIQESEESKPAEPDEKEKAQVLRLIELAESTQGVELFRDEYDTAFVRVAIEDHLETLNCRSRKFFLWLLNGYLEKYKTMPQHAAVSLAIQALEGKALFKGKRYELRNRVAQTEDAIWYDLADDKGRAVRITSGTWDIVSNPPNLFQREKHMLPQAEPVRGGSLAEFLSFVNITEPSQQVLLLAYLVSCFIPNFPHPILYLYGQRGSAKSTTSKLIRKLVDPSKIEVVSLPKDRNQAAQQLLHHHFIFYENVSHISSDISDLLCIAVTGGGFESREFYTNADAFIFNIRTNVGINGINITAVKPDLLERSILIELERIGDGKRRKEEEVYAAFEEARPRILGAIFDAAAKAIAIRPSIKLDGMPRMADFAEWGCAITEALGYKQSDFLRAYGQKLEQQEVEALKASSEAQLVIGLMEGNDVWEGSPEELLGTLKGMAAVRGEFLSKKFAETANVLTRRLNQLKTNFLAVGIEYEPTKSGTRLISIRRLARPLEAVESPVEVDTEVEENVPEDSPPDDKGGSDDVF